VGYSRKYKAYIRNSIGGIRVDIRSPKMKVVSVRVVSNESGMRVKHTGDWPFELERKERGRVLLGKRSPQLGGEVRFINMDPSKGLKFEVNRKELRVTEFPDLGLENYTIMGPLLCWDLPKEPACFEFTRKFLGLELDRQGPRKKSAGRTLAQEQVENCDRLVFSAGVWNILGSLKPPESCEVVFESGAEIRFDPDAVFYIRGQVNFPKTLPRVTFAPKKDDWGGLVIVNPEKGLVVQNSRFTASNEFYFEGRRFTGALNILNPDQILVEENLFDQNRGDDGLNIIKGSAIVRHNHFINNRDAIDFDLAEGVIEKNIFTSSQDDGIDCGGCRGVRILKNHFSGSGDKGISVGEASTVTIEENSIESGNVGIAVKDGSVAKLSKNLIFNNKVGLSEYSKVLEKGSNADRRTRGDSWFKKNQISYKLNLKPLDLSRSHVSPIGTESFKVGALKTGIMKDCQVCHETGEDL